MVKKKEERTRKKERKKTSDEVAVTVETATVTVTGKERFVLKNGYARAPGLRTVKARDTTCKEKCYLMLLFTPSQMPYIGYKQHMTHGP
jgi:hypothetical protein